MADSAPDLQGRLREAESKVRTTEAELRDVKSRGIKMAVWSAIGGVALVAIGGQWFPGYQLDSTARANMDKAAAGAVGEVMVQLCAERFLREAGLESRVAGMAEAGSEWTKTTYIRDGAWALRPDGEKADHATAEKCQALIADRLSASK